MIYRGRFALAYTVLVLVLPLAGYATIVAGAFKLKHHTVSTAMPKPKLAKAMALMTAERFLGALVPPVDYKRACGEVEFKTACLRDWPKMRVAVSRFETRGVAIFSTVTEVGVDMDGITGVIEMKWYGDRFLITNLVQD